MTTKLHRVVCAALTGFGLLGASGVRAQTAPDPLLFQAEHGFIKLGLEAGIQAIIERHSFWDLSRTFAPTSTFNPNLGWGEAYIKPGILFEHRLSASVTAYGGLSAIASGTVKRDVFDIGDIGRIGVEEAYLGVRVGQTNTGPSFDLSAGPQVYKVGNGMLISDGGADGFERGALIFGPRRAWEMTVLARMTFGPLSIDGFYLDPNELRSNDTQTRIAGGKASYTFGAGQELGLAIGKVISSTAPYPQAAMGGAGAPTIIGNAREGLRFVQLWGKWNPLSTLPGLWVAGDLAVESSERIDMQAWGARGEIGYVLADMPLKPTLSYAWQSFSGDNPGTSRVERFDPLYYDGSPSGWATGSNGSFVFINSNVQAHRATLALTLTPQDFLTWRYAHVRANELNSPLQFGQATRLVLTSGVPALVAGVRNHHLI